VSAGGLQPAPHHAPREDTWGEARMQRGGSGAFLGQSLEAPAGNSGAAGASS
jgi:hypothetical protein